MKLTIFGRNPVLEALRSNFEVKQLYLQEEINLDEKISDISDTAQYKDVRINSISRKQLDKLSNREPHQGVAAEVDFQPRKLNDQALTESEGMYIYIREAQYEQNMGAIIRTAEVAGIAGVIIPPNHQITGTVARISMGAAFHIPIYQASLFPTIKQFQKNAYKVMGIERDGDKTVYSAPLSDPTLFIIGGEDRPISEEIASRCDHIITIPQFGQVNSLNMSVAAAVVIYEHVRQRK